LLQGRLLFLRFALLPQLLVGTLFVLTTFERDWRSFRYYLLLPKLILYGHRISQVKRIGLRQLLDHTRVQRKWLLLGRVNTQSSLVPGVPRELGNRRSLSRWLDINHYCRGILQEVMLRLLNVLPLAIARNDLLGQGVFLEKGVVNRASVRVYQITCAEVSHMHHSFLVVLVIVFIMAVLGNAHQIQILEQRVS
jgi:hypothetical protein